MLADSYTVMLYCVPVLCCFPWYQASVRDFNKSSYEKNGALPKIYTKTKIAISSATVQKKKNWRQQIKKA